MPGEAAQFYPFEIPFVRVPVLHYSTRGSPYERMVPVGMPHLGKYKKILDVVFFLYKSVEDATAGKNSGGTGFFVSIPTKRWPDHYRHTYCVTNWHVACRGASVVRLNTTDGKFDILESAPENWFFRPKWHDIAVLPLRVGEHHKVVGLDPSNFLTDEENEKLEIGPGDDVFMVGRFMDYDGVETNRSSVRFGHISMDGAPIKQPTNYAGDSIVIDLHSRTGYSGSPVFVYRTLGSYFLEGKGIITGEGHVMMLLGIHWGQFSEEWEIKEGKVVVETSENHNESMIIKGQYIKGLSGMTCVIPSAAIWELLQSEELQEAREASEQRMEKLLGNRGSLPVAESALPTTDENPRHKEDFNSLLDAAVKGPQSDDQT